MKRYEVVVADNFHYMDRDEYVPYGRFETREAAVAAAKAIVDGWLQDALLQGTEVSKLYQSYVGFGDDPFVVAHDGAPDVKFSAWDYARQRCDELKVSFHAEAQ